MMESDDAKAVATDAETLELTTAALRAAASAEGARRFDGAASDGEAHGLLRRHAALDRLAACIRCQVCTGTAHHKSCTIKCRP